MFPSAHLVRHAQAIAAVATGVAAIAGFTAYLMLRKQLTPEQKEEIRRTRLALEGRVIDGTLLETAPAGAEPQALIYRYRVSGVTYECGQDVSMLTSLLPDLGEASAIFGLPVQVRYDRGNPADSIVIAETWNGLWTQQSIPPGHHL